MKPIARIGRLTVITDTTVQTRYSHQKLAEMACRGGADAIQLRDKNLPDDEFVAVAHRVREICHRHGALLIVNDRVEAALRADADGVHVGRTDTPVRSARAMLGSSAIIGTSAGSVDEAREAEKAGANYIGFGHIFATSSKHKATPPVGIATLAAACAAVKIPVIAVGGINETNLAEVMRSGAWGVAVVAAVCAAENPEIATAQLRAAIDVGAQTQ